MVEANKDGRPSVPPQKELRTDVVPRLQKILGGEAGNAIVEGLLLVEQKGHANAVALELLSKRLDDVRTMAAGAKGIAEDAKATANSARTLSEEANARSGNAASTADTALGRAENALGTASLAQQKADNVEAHFSNLANDSGRDREEVNGRIDEMQNEVDTLRAAVNTFGRQVDEIKAIAQSVSNYTSDAAEIVKTAQDTVEGIDTRTTAGMDGVFKEIDEIRRSIPPPSGNGNGEAKAAEAEGDGGAGKQALELVKALETRVNGFIAAVTKAIGNIDTTLKMIGAEANLSDEQMEALETPSLEYDDTKGGL